MCPWILQIGQKITAPLSALNWYKDDLPKLIKIRVTSILVNQKGGWGMETEEIFQNVVLLQLVEIISYM